MQVTSQLPTDLVRAAHDLRVSVARIVRRLRQEVEAGELTASSLSVLDRLEHDGPAGPGTLAAHERVSPPVMCSTLAGLQEQGLVRRDPDPHDGRRVVMSLTAAGHRVLSARRSATSRRIARALRDGFSPDERRQLVDVLPLLDRLAAQL
jgi:DNA-binding MarR family transcriptional regulator